MANKSYSQIYYHFVWTTCERADLISPQWENILYRYIKEKCRLRRIDTLTIGGTSNHVHMLLRANPELSPSDIIGRIKGGSSHFVNEQRLVEKRFSWQEGYGVSSISKNETGILTDYIENQKKYHDSNMINEEYEKTYINVLSDVDYVTDSFEDQYRKFL